MNTPCISVVMSVYIRENRIDYHESCTHLKQSIDSILQQTFKDFEFIIINDGSSDSVKELLNNFCRSDVRIKLFHQENKGLIASLNFGIEKSQGKYIARMDADDISLPDRFELQYRFMENNREVSLLGSAINYIDQEGATIGNFYYPTTDSELKEKLPLSNYFAHSSVMMRTETVKRLGGYSQAYIHAEDYDLWLRFSETSSIANLPTILLQYRVHTSNISSNNIYQQVLSVIAARTAYRLSAKGINDKVLPHEEELLNYGVSKDEIAIGIMNSYIYWLKLARKMRNSHLLSTLHLSVSSWLTNYAVPKRFHAKLLKEISLCYLSEYSFLKGVFFFAKAIYTRYS